MRLGLLSMSRLERGDGIGIEQPVGGFLRYLESGIDETGQMSR